MTTQPMFSIILFCVFFHCLTVDASQLTRSRRQTGSLYLCGTYPNLYYSFYPCTFPQNRCPNGEQCSPIQTGATTCVNGCCCILPPNPQPQPPQPPVGEYGFCYDGERSNIRCSADDQCPDGKTCMNGLCCTETNDEFKYACGGQLSLGACTRGGQCERGYHCTSSHYCCECPAGLHGGTCRNGQGCPPGFTCQPNGYCCATCPDNQTPFGACRPGGVCGGNRRCVAGNICC